MDEDSVKMSVREYGFDSVMKFREFFDQLDGLKSNQQTRRHPYRVTNTSVTWIQYFSPDDRHMDARNM